VNTARIVELFGLDGKTALVTGGSRGIGAMIAGALLDAGATVFITSRKADACAAAADELSRRGPCEGFAGDVSTPEGCARLATDFRERSTRLDILVNNAGATWGAPLEDHTVESWDKVMNTNARGPFLLTQQLVPMLTEAASSEDPARIINVGSVDGLVSPVFESYSYSASKAAIHMLTRHLARHLADSHITVNAIAPGLFESKMTAFVFRDSDVTTTLIDRIPAHRAGEPDDVGGTAVWLASRAGSYLTGAVIPVSGGLATL
jgi:NAD(P)-dependent dehydrogenase (short-subunit alcohol dehydrogenase family)